jgi:hypothetical protein
VHHPWRAALEKPVKVFFFPIILERKLRNAIGMAVNENH